MAKTEHLNALDVARGLAIVSVMYGHALAPWVFNAGANFSEAAFLQWKFGAAFMMPFFFFVSGLGWREEKSLASTARQALTLVLIALLASAAYDFARLIAGATGVAAMLGQTPPSIVDYLTGLARMILFGDYYSLSPLWFIAALAVVRVCAAIAVRLHPAGAMLLSALVVALSAAAVEFDWRSFYQLKPLGVAFLFFLAGRIARNPFCAFERKPGTARALALIGGAVLAATFHLNEGCRWDVFARCGAQWLDGRFGVALIHGQIGNAPLFALTAFAGVAFACGVSILLARYGGIVGRKLDAWGGNSLNLLIVNSVFLHVGNAFVDLWVVPNFAPDAFFFVALFSLTLIANVLAASVLERPLRWLHRIALTASRILVDTLTSAPALPWVQRASGVSQRND